jgi:hypothetical protein
MTTEKKVKVGSNRLNRPDDLLAGRCFMQLAEDGLIELTGVIWGRVEPGIYLIQYFDAMMGEPNNLEIVPIQKLMTWRLEEDDAQLRHAIEYGFAGARSKRAWKARQEKADEK